MSSRPLTLLAITAWLAATHAILAGLFWLLLQVPESNLAMLAASALIVLVLLAGAGWVEGAGMAAWPPGPSWPAAIRRAARGPVGFVAGLVPFALVWLAVALGRGWWNAHRGEVDAWLMLHFAWTRTAGLHATVDWIWTLLRYLVGLSLLLTAVAWAVERGLPALLHVKGWLRAALSPLRLLVIAVLLFTFLWLPWRAVYWRPAGLAPNWQEAAFVGVKLGLLYLLANLGWAAILCHVKNGIATTNGGMRTENEKGGGQA